MGAITRPARDRAGALQAPRGRTAIIVPIYNEDTATTFSRVAAMNRSLIGLGVAESFHFAILSDSNDLAVAAAELAWFEQLIREPLSEGRMFYRRRERNIAKKAGNIEDFVSRSGGAYDYALVLDADSLMDGAAICRLALKMDADPGLGLVQTVPQVIHARTLFGRMMCFSSAYLSPYFASGMSLMQGREGPYWGHNAIVRMRAFAACCGLPVLSGKPPYGGHILSHDYVEAALLARGGWKVELDPAIERIVRGGAGEPHRIWQARPALVPGKPAAPAADRRARAEVLEPLHVRAGHHGLCRLAAVAAAAALEHRGGDAAG